MTGREHRAERPADLILGEGIPVIAKVDATAFSKNHFDNIEPIADRRPAQLPQVLMRGLHQAPAFLRSDGIRRPGQALAMPGFDLDETEDRSVSGDEVDFPFIPGIIPGQEFQAEFPQQLQRQGFAALSQPQMRGPAHGKRARFPSPLAKPFYETKLFHRL